MSAAKSDWLDRLAQRTAGTSAAPTAAVATPSSEERFSRGTAVKLALAGAASTSFALWRAAPLKAEDCDLGKCTKGCVSGHERELNRRLDACDTVFGGAFVRKVPLWRSIGLTLTLPGAMIGPVLGSFCCNKEAALLNASRDNCIKRCIAKAEQAATGSRWLQGLRSTCEPPPPATSSPPQVPPPPSGDDACWSCAQVGGLCCPGPDPTTLCACANPELGCEAYGC